LATQAQLHSWDEATCKEVIKEGLRSPYTESVLKDSFSQEKLLRLPAEILDMIARFIGAISKPLSTKEFFIADLKSGELYFPRTTLECEIFDFSTLALLRSLMMARHGMRTWLSKEKHRMSR
jgi:hypothetical protein